MSAEQMTLAAFVLAPVVILGVVGMIRGYHLTLKVWKHGAKQKEGKHGNDR